MTTACIRFQCPSCRARIKAPLPLAGRARHCPGCSHALRVPADLPEDSGAVLVAVEGLDYYKLGVQGGDGPRKPWWHAG
jgi:hypothetical protein